MFASHHRLSNLVAVIDLNGQQALGYTRDVLDLSNMAERWRAFRWHVEEVDGHNVARMADAIEGARRQADGPQMLIARTVFGKGVSFMENHIKWHYWPLSDQECRQALAEIIEAQMAAAVLTQGIASITAAMGRCIRLPGFAA